MIPNTAALLQLAYGQYAIGAFSVNSIEQILGAFRGAADAAAPLIIQVSYQARRYAEPGVLEAAVHAAACRFPRLVFALHLDHGDEPTCYECIESGFYSSVMIDASAHPLEENIAITRRVVERAHARGIAVEAELGRLSGKEDDIAVEEGVAFLTDPDQAAEFVTRSGCDALAVAVGTSHGVHKFAATGQLHLERLEAIRQRLPGFPLVLHGASSVPAEEVARINAAGGAVAADAHGVPEAMYLEAARRGVAKINIDTDSRLVWARVMREYLRDHPATIDLREPGRAFMAAYAERVAHLCRCFGCAGRLDEVRRRLGL
ncbi:MAG: class II fructose-bisphosphate aldolase [Halothiobacillaceae bacterium]